MGPSFSCLVQRGSVSSISHHYCGPWLSVQRRSTSPMIVPIHAWAYAFRIRLAAVIALYVAFWLQLGGAEQH